MTGAQWVEGINRLNLQADLPVTLQGGEPTVHKDFYEIVAGIKPEINIDLLTNLEFDVQEFMRRIPQDRMMREAPYASIRVSYHRGQSDLKILLKKTCDMADQGYSIGIWAVDHPEYHEETLDAQRQAWALGIDFRLKEFLGPWEGKVHGTFRYSNAVDSHVLRFCGCRTSELLIAPDGNIHRCHSDLYAARFPIGHIANDTNPLVGEELPCSVMGRCNSCDIKVKTDRFQRGNWSSVTIRNIVEPYTKNDFIGQVENTYGKADKVKVDTKPN